jgi:hypothetical protein
MAKVYIRYNSEFLDLFDQPMSVPDPDRKKQNQAREYARAMSIKLQEQVFPEVPMIEDATFAQIVMTLAGNIPYGDPPGQGEPALISRPDEQLHAANVMRAFKSHHPEYVEIESDDLEWFKTLLEEHGGRMFRGVAAQLVRERMDDALDIDEVTAARDRENTVTPIREGYA